MTPSDGSPTVAHLALGRFSADGAPFSGLLVDGSSVVDLTRERTGWPGLSTLNAALENWDFVVDALPGLAAEPADHQLGDLHVHAPFLPRAILQSAANYRSHVIDLAMSHRHGLEEGMTMDDLRREKEREMDHRAAHGEPFLFMGSPSAICGPYDEVVLPADGEKHDWELELAVVIGRAAHNISPEQALDHIAGYAVSNDLTTREKLGRSDAGAMGADFFAAKNAPTFTPFGPYLVPRSQIPDVSHLHMTLHVNGELRQDAMPSDMIFDIAQTIAYASRTSGLAPGDVLLTGSPAGNAAHWGHFLVPGDVLEGAIEGLGQQRNVCVGGQPADSHHTQPDSALAGAADPENSEGS